ncbi:MAG: polysaccharide pyruvyl transferase family protein [Lentisphaeria bacterium]|nr:polysaccharide pyruvyl transferase family protein [Lentisphaeria bacterium]
MKKILLRNSWQVNNIGDIAHPLGFLNLAKQFLPECEIWLWPCIISPAVREIILRNFPGLNLVETEEALQKAFAECDLLINGSSAGMEAAGILDWKERTGKPYGLFGVSADGLWTEKRKTILSGAAFVFCRDSLSQYFLKQQNLECPMIGFTPDSTFGMKLLKSPAADLYMKENGLEPEKFICVIPRLRFTPSGFDEQDFYYKDPNREIPSKEKIELDMEKLREVIAHIVKNYDLKVLICPETDYQVPMGRRYLYERLPEDIREKVVLKRDFWLTDEAESVYSQAKLLLSMEMHSPIIFIDEHRPAVLLRQAEDTWKGQMWRDIGLQDWILELNISDAALIAERVDMILQDYPAALQQAATASKRAIEFEQKAMEYIADLLK